MSLERTVVARLRQKPAVVDVLVGLALGVVFVVGPLVAPEGLGYRADFSLKLTGMDVALTAVSAVALTQVRRRPAFALVVTMAAALVSIVGGWEVNLAQFAVAIALFGYVLERPRRRGITAAVIATVLLGAAAIFGAGVWRGQWGRQDAVLLSLLATAFAIAVQGRRAAMVALEDRARRAEETREETARRRVVEDRLEIARELHDVIAHHVAVMSVQSGVAEHMVERDPAAAREALHRVRVSAKSVLSELQSVLGVLRQDESTLPTTPAPGLPDVESLVESFRSTGSSVELVVPSITPALAPTAGLAAFRLVQEALTNVQKHAAGALTTVAWKVDGGHVEIGVANSQAPGAAVVAPTPGLDAVPSGSGLGLVGMRERVLAAGGTLESGPTADGGFRVAARLPLEQENP